MANSLLQGQVPALGAGKISTLDSKILGRVISAPISREARALYLLNIASDLLRGFDPIKYPDSFNKILEEPRWSQSFRGSDGTWLGSAASVAATQTYPYVLKHLKVTSASSADRKRIAEIHSLTEEAVEQAVALLRDSSKPALQLPLLYIASRQCRLLGREKSREECLNQIERTVRQLENNPSADPSDLKTAALVLNLRAYELIPLHISVLPNNFIDTARWGPPPDLSDLDEEKFKTAQALKVRSVTLLDSLPSDNHERRLAHRNLALWYMKLEKKELAEAEKSILFNLVGINDDRILQPQSRGCGQVEWWQIPKGAWSGACGMG